MFGWVLNTSLLTPWIKWSSLTCFKLIGKFVLAFMAMSGKFASKLKWTVKMPINICSFLTRTCSLVFCSGFVEWSISQFLNLLFNFLYLSYVFFNQKLPSWRQNTSFSIRSLTLMQQFHFPCVSMSFLNFHNRLFFLLAMLMIRDYFDV